MSDDIDAKLSALEQKFREIVVSTHESDNTAARKIALGCLEPRWSASTDQVRAMNFSSISPVAVRYLTSISKGEPIPFGFGKLETELQQICDAFNTLASRLKMSAEAGQWVNSSWADERRCQLVFQEERILREQSGAGSEVFPQVEGEITPFVMRLEALARLMEFLTKQAKEAKLQANGAKSIFFRESSVEKLFRGCGQALIDRGHGLNYLRPIAEAIYDWAHGAPPTIAWGVREEKSARAALGKNPLIVTKKRIAKR